MIVIHVFRNKKSKSMHEQSVILAGFLNVDIIQIQDTQPGTA